MDNSVPVSVPLPHLSPPQIRSRITVVCAECKRLKLKCDRRNPCGSCTKRDTISRCIYSPAAAEKVDLHSLNNRLIHVEATLSLITSGQTPPVFQSSYPFSQFSSPNPPSSIFNSRSSPSQPGSRQHYHQHHSLSPRSLNPSVSVSQQDLSSLWLDKLEHSNLPPLEINLPLSSSSVSNQNNPVKLEGISDTEFSLLRSQLMETHMSHLHLPHSSIYYPSPSSQRAQPPLSTASSSQALTEALSFSDAPATKPCVTPALIAFLPPVARATLLLQNAANVFSARPVPFPACLLSTLSDESGHGEKGDKKGKRKACFSSLPTQWDAFKFRALCLIGGRGLTVGSSSAKFDRKERGRASARAREIFFGDGVSSRTGMLESLSRTPVEEQEATKLNAETEQVTSDQERISRESLSFFATVCMVLAMGAAASEALKTRENEMPARGGRETSEFFYALALQSLDIWEKNMVIVSPTVSDKDNSRAENTNEEERLDYLVANLLGIGYQLFQFQLKNDYEQRRNSLSKLLPIVAKMINMARIFGLENSGKQSLCCKEDLIGKERWKRGKSRERWRRKDGLKALIWWDIVFYELFISDTLGHPSLLSVPKHPCYADPFMSSDEVDSDHEEQEEILAAENLDHAAGMYHSARCRLTKVAQIIKSKLVYPDCCCGYTLDQAAALEGQVNHFLENIPPSLRLKAGDDVSKGDALYSPEEYSGTDRFERDALQMQRCELAIIAQRLIIMAYLPFLRRHPMSWQSTSTTPMSNKASQTDDMSQGAGSVRNPVLQPILSAAQCVVQASLHLLSCKTYQKHPQQVPLLLGLYPVEKALLDAVIICTYATTFHASQISKNAVNSAVSGMQMLRDSGLRPECKALFERLQKRFLVIPNHALAHGIKRKHEQITVPGAGHFNAKSPKDNDDPSIDHCASRNQPPTIHQERAPPDMLASKQRNPNDLVNGRNPDTGEKNKKHAKKSHPYPPVGIRVRQGKGHPPFLKPKASPTMTSRIRVDDGTSQHRQGLDLQPTLNYISHRTSDVRPPPDHQDSVMPSLLQNATYRSPPSLDHDLHGSSQVISFTVQSSRDADNGSCMNDSARLDAYDRGRQPPQGMQFNPTGSFEGDENREQQRTSFSSPYLQGVASATVDSSPYGSSDHLSPVTGSPYTSSGNSMPTPTSSFGQVSRTVVPDQPTSSTYAHAYYHMDSNDDFNTATYNQTQVQENVSYTGVRLDTAGEQSSSVINGSPIGGTGMAATVPSPPVYEKTSSTMYGIRLPMDGLGQEQIDNHPLLQQTPYGANQRQRHSISMTEQTWPSQPTVATDGSQRYWVEDFKYFH